MIVRLTNVAAQTLGAYLQPSWRTWTLGTSGEILIEKFTKKFGVSGSSRKGRSVKNGSCPSPPVGRCISTRRPPPLPRSGRATASPAPTPPTLTSAPTQVSTAPSRQSHIDQSSSDFQTRCSATSGSGSQPPTTLSPFRGTSFTTTASSFWLVDISASPDYLLLSCSVP